MPVCTTPACHQVTCQGCRPLQRRHSMRFTQHPAALFHAVAPVWSIGRSEKAVFWGSVAYGPPATLPFVDRLFVGLHVVGAPASSMSYRSPVLLASPAPTTSSTGASSRPGGAHTPIDSLPLLASSFASRLARTASNASSAAGGGSPMAAAAAGARGGAVNLPPASSGQQQQQLLHTPMFGSGQRFSAAAGSPGFGAPGGSAGLRPRASPLAPGSAGGGVGGGPAVLDSRFGSSSHRRLSAPTGYSESGMSGESARLPEGVRQQRCP
jgi:hypothetical protein